MISPAHHSHRRASTGMVLLEVMAALVIFSLVAFSLVEALSTAFDAANNRDEVDAAIRGLSNQMALLHSARVVPGAQDQPDDGSGITYHVAIEQVQMQDQNSQPIPNTYRATITATWKARGDVQERDVSQLIYQP